MVRRADLQAKQHRDRAQQAFGLPPWTAKRQAQQVPGLDRHLRVGAGAAALSSVRRLPGRARLGRDPNRQAPTLLQRPVILRPVGDLVARPRDLVAARLIGLVGHRSSRKQRSGPIRSQVPPPKPTASDLCTNARMRESRPYGSVRGRSEMGAPTAIMEPAGLVPVLGPGAMQLYRLVQLLAPRQLGPDR